MYEVGVVARFGATHALRGDFGPASVPHGHAYRVEVAARGPALRDDGTLCDIGRLRTVVADVLAELDGRDLDETAVFGGRNTTAEAVAEMLCRRVAEALREPGVVALAVEVWESDDAYARYEADVTPPA